MSQQMEAARAEVGRAAEMERPWWRQPPMVALWVLVLVTLIYIWSNYIALDRSLAKVQLPAEYPMKYPLVIAHIAFGSIALVAGSFQLWGSFRRRYPAAHRYAGRIYVFGGVLPGAICTVVLLGYTGGPGFVGRSALGTLWVATTGIGYYMVRRRRYAEHRRYMIYSYALTLDAFSVRLLALVIPLIMGVQNLDPTIFVESVSWLGWLFNLLVAHWWIERGRRPQRKAVRAA